MIEHPSLDKPTSGSIRFNTDSSKLEIYNGEAWFEIDATSPEEQTGGTRGLLMESGSENVNTISFVNISTTGNASNFGDCNVTSGRKLTPSSRTRGIIAGGYPASNVIDFVTIAQEGDAQDFGDLNGSTGARDAGASISNGTRGVMAITHSPSGIFNVMHYITIASTGNSLDFGDTSTGNGRTMGASSPTRGIIFWGNSGGPAYNYVNNIEYITTSTLGNSADFGDKVQASTHGGSFSNAIRAVTGGGVGDNSGNITNVIQFVTIATLGNAQDFGDLTYNSRLMGSASSTTRGIFAGGLNPTVLNTISYVQIMSTGDSIDFGDMTSTSYGVSGLSNGHGGLG